MLDKVRHFIKENKLVMPGDKIILGVSGGADSVALLLLLADLSKELECTLHAVHVNHGLRGEEALHDQHFTEKLCGELKVPLTVICEDVAKVAKEAGISCEEAGRRVRYDSFETIAEETGARKIAVAHHMDDNAETLLFRMARGTGLRGLSGMPPSRQYNEMTLIRPLLCVTRSEIEAWLRKQGAAYCTDSTNLTDDYSRNLIRNRVVPVLKEINNGAVANICALSEQIRAVEDYMLKQAMDTYGDCIEAGKNAGTLQIRLPKQREQVLFDIILRWALFKVAEHEKDITALHIKLLRELCEKQTGSSISLPYGVSARKSYDCLLLRKNNADNIHGAQAEPCCLTGIELGSTVEIEWQGYGTFVFSIINRPENNFDFSKEPYTKYFDYDKMSKIPELRYAKAEDVIAISPTGGTKTVGKLFTDCKISLEERGQLPVIAEDNNILWIPGVRTGENRRIEAATQKILKIEWRPV